MKEYIYQVEHQWEKQRQPIHVDQQHQHRRRRALVSREKVDADLSSLAGRLSHY